MANSHLRRNATQLHGWWHTIAVTRCVQSAKLLYTGSG